MLDADKARELSLEHGNKVLTNVQEVDEALYKYIELKITNACIDVSMKVAGALAQDLINRGFKVYATINPHKEICEFEVEW